MPLRKTEPIEPTMWFERAARLLERFHSNGRADELESSIRRAYHLVQMTPRPLRPLLRPAIDEAAFESLLSTGALESAAMGIVGAPGGIAVSRAYGATQFEAVVWLHEDCGGVIPAKHDHAAGAIVGALLECLVALQSVGSDIRAANDHELTRPRRRTLQSGQHPQKKPH
jgi:hypothetical protein